MANKVEHKNSNRKIVPDFFPLFRLEKIEKMMDTKLLLVTGRTVEMNGAQWIYLMNKSVLTGGPRSVFAIFVERKRRGGEKNLKAKNEIFIPDGFGSNMGVFYRVHESDTKERPTSKEKIESELLDEIKEKVKKEYVPHTDAAETENEEDEEEEEKAGEQGFGGKSEEKKKEDDKAFEDFADFGFNSRIEA